MEMFLLPCRPSLSSLLNVSVNMLLFSFFVTNLLINCEDVSTHLCPNNILVLWISFGLVTHLATLQYFTW